MGATLLVSENATEPVCDVRSAVETTAVVSRQSEPNCHLQSTSEPRSLSVEEKVEER